MRNVVGWVTHPKVSSLFDTLKAYLTIPRTAFQYFSISHSRLPSCHWLLTLANVELHPPLISSVDALKQTLPSYHRILSEKSLHSAYLVPNLPKVQKRCQHRVQRRLGQKYITFIRDLKAQVRNETKFFNEYPDNRTALTYREVLELFIAKGTSEDPGAEKGRKDREPSLTKSW